MNHPDTGLSTSELFAAVDAVANRLADPRDVHLVPSDGRRHPQALAGGAAGISLLHLERAHAGHGDWATAHAWLATAAREPLSAGPNACLFFGAPALAFITHAAADQQHAYERALAALDTGTIAVTRQRLDRAHARIRNGERPLLSEFDTVRGLAGLGAYHLQRHPDDDITRAVLAYFVTLTKPLPGESDGLPGWWTDVAPNGSRTRDFPGGHGNLGMSHGIAAPLALLSLAHLQGLTVDGHAGAIARICTWLDAWQQEHPCGPWWPGFVTRQHANQAHVPASSRQRPSWCYGTPGIARALQLAGMTTSDTERQQTAIAAMLGCLRDPAQLERVTGIGLCHGTAGLLHATWRIQSDAHAPDLTTELPRLSDLLVTELQLAPAGGDAEFLDGAGGAALALHTVATNTVPCTRWDTCLLLA